MTTEQNKAVIAARAYLARGLSVFPLTGKVPLTEHGVKDASNDRALVEKWFQQPRNIGIAIPPGVVVVDIDPRNGGMDSWIGWLDAYGTEQWTDIPCAQTGGGGYHYWFRLPAGVEKLKKNPADGIDLLTHGRYVVAPPSVTDEKYVWDIALPQDLGELDELPGFITALARIEERPQSEEFSSVREHASGGDALDEAAHKYTTWESLLHAHGWKRVSDTKWRHPTSENPFSATIKHDCLFVYSPNTPFPETTSGDPHGVTLYAAIETLEYRGDRKACLTGLREANCLEDRSLVSGSVSDVLPGGASTAVGATGGDRTRQPDEPTTLSELDKPRLDLSTYDDVVMRRTRWLWEGRIPMGGLTLLAGREGEGKSTLAINTAAGTTRGTLEGEYFGVPKDVIIVATEDSAEHTIKPRLVAAGADMSRVHRIEMLDPTDSLSLPVHLPDLELACARHDVALIIMDPLLSRLSGNLDSHKDADVRRALEPLGAFADRIHAAILGLIHLNKSGSTDPLTAVMASKAFTAFARSVLFAMVDPDDENQRLLGLVKANLGRTDLPTLTYTFDPVVVGWDEGDIVATRIVWGEPSETSIRKALEMSTGTLSAVEECAVWLGDYLASEGGSAPFQTVVNAAKKHGVDASIDTLRRALPRANGEIRRVGFPSTSIWVLKGVAIPVQ